jgi:hypothetical protein
MRARQVAFGSDEYFDLLAAHPDWGATMALGSRVVFVVADGAYEIVEGEPEPRPQDTDDPAPAEPPTAVPTVASNDGDEPQATPESVVPAANTGLCAGSLAMLGVALAFAVFWQRLRL